MYIFAEWALPFQRIILTFYLKNFIWFEEKPDFFSLPTNNFVALTQFSLSGDPSIIFFSHHRRITKDAGVVPLFQVCLSLILPIDVKKTLSKGQVFIRNNIIK